MKYSLNKEQASALLSTFNRPEKCVNESRAHTKEFVSNPEYLSSAYVYGGCLPSDDGLLEITIGWEGIDSMEDAAHMDGYQFYTDSFNNWQGTVKAVKDHLKEIIGS